MKVIWGLVHVNTFVLRSCSVFGVNAKGVVIRAFQLNIASL